MSKFEEFQKAFVKAAKAAPKHVGGGWYELPDGTRVQGKEAALKAMA